MEKYPITCCVPNYVYEPGAANVPMLDGTKLIQCPADCPALPKRPEHVHPLCANYPIPDYEEFSDSVPLQSKDYCPGLEVQEIRKSPPTTEIVLYGMWSLQSDYDTMGWDEADRFGRYMGGGDCPIDCPARSTQEQHASCTIHPRTFKEFDAAARAQKVDIDHCPTIYLHNK